MSVCRGCGCRGREDRLLNRLSLAVCRCSKLRCIGCCIEEAGLSVAVCRDSMCWDSALNRLCHWQCVGVVGKVHWMIVWKRLTGSGGLSGLWGAEVEKIGC